MREFQLRVASTFYDNNRKYNTWLGLPNAITKRRQAYEIDHIFIPKNQLSKTPIWKENSTVPIAHK